MKSHYLHLVKLGITLKYIKKNQVDDVLNKKLDFTYGRLQEYLKKSEWNNLWRIYIENSITSLFVRHGLLDKKLLLVIIDDLIHKAKQKKAISGPMVAVQKNLLGQKIVDRAFHNILSKKVKLPKEIYIGFLKEGFLTEDSSLFGLDFLTEDPELIEEVAPIEQSPVKKETTIVSDSSSADPTRKIHYPEDMHEDVSPGEDTVNIYKDKINYTQEVCRDLVVGTAEMEEVQTSKRLLPLIICVGIIFCVLISYYLWPKSSPQFVIAEVDSVIAQAKTEKKWNRAREKYWQALMWYDKNLKKLPHDLFLWNRQLKLLTEFFERALQKRQWYLANAIANECKVSLKLMLAKGFIDKKKYTLIADKLQDNFNEAIKQ
ncbi:hypothetical protein [Candidatus Uabimicrobium sp. HlEnr_7]|uniref:hypothetical protein n=1 Tax=Candidatus Uabimicrobium helgolandensis TaxID=3095367 RepID=UPI003555F36A